MGANLLSCNYGVPPPDMWSCGLPEDGHSSVATSLHTHSQYSFRRDLCGSFGLGPRQGSPIRAQLRQGHQRLISRVFLHRSSRIVQFTQFCPIKLYFLLRTIHLLRAPLGPIRRRRSMRCTSRCPPTLAEDTKDPSDSRCGDHADNDTCYRTATKAAA